ncbi:uncharacterized protein [Temnothorax longispinosus]|uniref:uncharacterized protein n=1 Tax=Temnothorax longispinosus TaxID=300112 RepID=UPI003A99C630
MGKLRKKWSDEELIKALADIRSGQSINSTSKSSGIPKSTLMSKVKGNRPIGRKPGPPTILSTEEEAKIARWMLYLSQRGFPVTKTQLIHSVTYLIKQLDRETPFTDGRPGRHWYEGFLRRHPEISISAPQTLPKSRASVTELTEDILHGWFKEVKQHLVEKQLINIDGSRVFNCDEYAFCLSPKNNHVKLVKKRDKAVHNLTQNREKEFLTVLFMTNATDALISPMIVFPYERIPYSVSQSVPTDWGIGKSENGWMTAETFYKYISNIFEPWLTAQNIERPVILYVDGHSSHMTLPVVEFCMNHQIELRALLPNATHLIQPLDVALFRTSLESSWRDCINDWRVQNHRNLRREDFGPLLKIAIERVKLPKVMSDGFRKCGLFPFSADALQYNQLPQKTKKKSMTPVTAENHLLFFESTIDENLLGEFRRANETGTYSGNVKNLGLFFYWQKILKLSGNSVYQGIEGEENILPLKNPENNLTDESLSQEYPSLQFADDSIDIKPNDFAQIVVKDEIIPAEPSQLNTDEDMTMNEASNANTTGDMQLVSVSDIINDNDVYKKTTFWPHIFAPKVEVPSVACEEYH